MMPVARQLFKYKILSNNTPKPDSYDYDVRKFPWYNPQSVIKAVHILSRQFGEINFYKGTEFQKAREMFEVAIATIGLFAMNSANKFFLQPNFQNVAPEVVTAMQIEEPNKLITLGISHIEHTSLTEHTESNDVVKFLKETKFHKNYPDHTIILLVIKKRIQLDADRIVKELQEIRPKWTIFIVGKLQNSEKWMIFSPCSH